MNPITSAIIGLFAFGLFILALRLGITVGGLFLLLAGGVFTAYYLGYFQGRRARDDKPRKPGARPDGNGAPGGGPLV